MSQDDARVVGWRYVDQRGYLRAALDRNWLGSEAIPLVPLSLLAEAERQTNDWYLKCDEALGKVYARDMTIQALQSRLDAVVGSDLKAAYELLWSHTSVGTYGRQCIETLRGIAHPEEVAAKDAARKDHCPYCFSWVGGPLICCDNGYMNPQNLDHITKAEAEQLRAALGGESPGNDEERK